MNGSGTALTLGILVLHSLAVLLVGVRLVGHIFDLDVLETTLVVGGARGKAQLFAALVVVVSGFFDRRTTDIL